MTSAPDRTGEEPAVRDRLHRSLRITRLEQRG